MHSFMAGQDWNPAGSMVNCELSGLTQKEPDQCVGCKCGEGGQWISGFKKWV